MSKSDAEIEKLIQDYSKSILLLIGSYKCEKNGIDKDDLIQEIRIRIWKIYKADGRNIANFYSYLKKITNSVFINEIKKINKEKQIVNICGRMDPLYESSEEKEIDQNNDLRYILDKSLGMIKESQRRTIQLRLSGFSFDEIARINRWSIRKTCNLFYRGLNKLKQQIRERGGGYED